MAFFNETRHAYGRTALLLSGGAFLGMLHIFVTTTAAATTTLCSPVLLIDRKYFYVQCCSLVLVTTIDFGVYMICKLYIVSGFCRLSKLFYAAMA